MMAGMSDENGTEKKNLELRKKQNKMENTEKENNQADSVQCSMFIVHLDINIFYLLLISICG